MVIIDICIKTPIKSFKHVTNMSIITNTSLEYVYDARIVVINFETKSKLCEGYGTILDLGRLAIDRVSFRRCPGSD